MPEFKKYIIEQVAELREFEEGEQLPKLVSVSQADLLNGSPKKGDMIRRNPKNHDDQWLVAEEYFKNNFKSMPDEG